MKLLILIITTSVLTACSSTKESKMTENDQNQIVVTAKVIQEQFTNKGGRDIEGSFDYFLEYDGKKMFIKFMDSEITFEEIEPLIGKKATFQISERQGLWDTNNPEIQSRIGEYVVIWAIVSN